MKNIKQKSAFTMIELVFVIVIIGILASVAIPRLAATRDDAEISKARVVVASVRNALAMERQKRILRGEFDVLTAVGDSTNVFGNFYDVNGDTGTPVLEYSIANNTSRKKGHWHYYAALQEYAYDSGSSEISLVITNGRFVCAAPNSNGCKLLTK